MRPRRGSALMFLYFTLATMALAQSDEPPIRSSFVAQRWFSEHLKGWKEAEIKEIRPVAYGEWTTGGGLLGSPLLMSGLSPAKQHHLAMIHCWRVKRPGHVNQMTYLFAESLTGKILKVKTSSSENPSKIVDAYCGQ